MDKNYKEFKIDLEEFFRKTKKTYETRLREATIQAYKTGIQESRVHTGQFRLNWNVRLGFVDPNTKGKPDATPQKGMLPTSAEWQLSGVQAVTAQLKAGRLGSIYISNNLPYAKKLNEEDNYLDKMISNAKKVIEYGD